MKRTVTLFNFFILLLAASEVFSQTVELELHHKILTMKEASAPSVVAGNVVFSYKAPAATQMVGLAFEHEKYKTIYKYQRNPHGIFVLTVPIEEHTSEFNYRLIVDGLWMADPTGMEVQDKFGIKISKVSIRDAMPQRVKGIKFFADGSIQFGYNGSPGSRIYLVGDFNNWDPFMTPMVESPVFPGYYSIIIKQPANFKYYRYVVDGREILDPKNSLTSRNGWGESVSSLPPR